MNPLPLDPTATVSLSRVYQAAPERLFAAWTQPALLRKWWGPEGVETLALDVDVRVGGKWNWRLRTPEGEERHGFGEYLEVTPPRKLSFTWKWADDPDWDGVKSIVTVQFDPTSDGTELTLTHEGFPSEQSRENHRGGWTSILEKLAKTLNS